ncbi:helix-turn-helix transcriptional regulator [Pseudomonas sp. OIL-1]|uniref:helix-turn-helix transcriptional regulator n=1 Tax=Pseudomonas sp. OIL-1 TaxID=2706126 RepID=UPI0013A759CA|nr:helix-turn-helix transcriptional regulator [Pseudomonas sp. OIL-1]QIB50951.1 helix-turn-helix transcriptional regulator [Pseudomonas sp. OIL-1]
MSVIKTPVELGAAIKQARKQLGLTQSQLALAAGVGVRFIGDLEAGKPTAHLGLTLTVIQAVGGELTLTGMPMSEEIRNEA